MSVSAQENERILEKLFQYPARFIFEGIEYETEISDKPRSQDGDGEPIRPIPVSPREVGDYIRAFSVLAS